MPGGLFRVDKEPLTWNLNCTSNFERTLPDVRVLQKREVFYSVRKLYIGNLPFSATDDMLRHIFEQVGTVRSAKVVTDFDTGRSKGYGFVEMATPDDAKEAILRFNGDTYEGRVVTVAEARPSAPRTLELQEISR
jgi:cold-inducible RNA-binding protein